VKYKNYAKTLKATIKAAEINYYSSKFKSNIGDYRQTWKLINTIINPNQNPPKIDKIKENNIIIDDPKIIADNFNTYFTNIGPKLAATIPLTQGDIYNTLGPSKISSITFFPCDRHEINKIINNIKQDTSPGLDGLTPTMIKVAAPYIDNILVTIINASLEAGVFPDNLKIARVTPIYKEGEKDLVSNYRPISVLNCISKIFETVIYNRLLNYLNTYDIITNSQFGFRKGRTTAMPLIEAIDKITAASEASHSTIAVFLDLKKAFDTLNHDLLLKKLYHYGIRGVPFKLLKDYLTNRTQQVYYNNTYSNLLPISTGVPQGSILGPLLFIVFINDIVNTSEILDFYIFADDTNVLASGSNIYDLSSIINLELKKMNNWFLINKLSINTEKTKYMLFHAHKNEDTNFTISINDITIERVSSCKFLGVLIDSKLNWKKHITYLQSKLSCAIGLIYRIRYKINKGIFLLIYNALIGSHLSYCNIVWGSTYHTSLNSLFILQKKAIKIGLKLPKLTHDADVFKSTNILTVYQLNTLQTVTFVYSALNFLLPSKYHDYFSIIANLHSHNLRSKTNLQIYFMKTNLRKFSIKNRGPILWNKVPNDIRSSYSIYSFKKLYKLYLLNSTV
jgi:hypothetical protein